MIRDPLKQAAYTAAAAILPLADNFARDGNLDAAVSKYEEAITLDQSLHFDPLYRARQQAASLIDTHSNFGNPRARGSCGR